MFVFFETPGRDHRLPGVFYYTFKVLIINLIRKFFGVFCFVFSDIFFHLFLEEKPKERQSTKAQWMQGKTQLLPGVLLRHANRNCPEQALPPIP